MKVITNIQKLTDINNFIKQKSRELSFITAFDKQLFYDNFTEVFEFINEINNNQEGENGI